MIFPIGQEVALYTKEKFIIELKKLQSFKARDYSTALREVFIAMDELIKSPQGQRDLLKYSPKDET
jgi:hypothetical protein